MEHHTGILLSKIMDYHNTKGQIIGRMRDGIFRKLVNKKKHLMRIYNAWGIQYAVVQQIKDECTEIRIKDISDESVYSIPFKDFMSKAHVEDHGDGMQAFCELEHFAKHEKTI